MRSCYNLSAESGRVDHRSKEVRLLPKPSFRPAPAPASHGWDRCLPSSSTSSTEARAAAALRIHSMAEKRRRERINNHLTTLRRMIPNSSKLDKASLLARVIDEVRDLGRNASLISEATAVPSETNRVLVECENEEIKATLCCDDRPDLFSDLAKAFHTLKLTAVRADLTSLGGRVYNIFTLSTKDDDGSVCLHTLAESIRKVLIKIVSARETAA